VFGQTNKGGTDLFRRFTRDLPEVDRVEVITLSPVLSVELKTADCRQPGLMCARDNFPYKIGPSKRLEGDDAKRLVVLWRALQRDSFNKVSGCLVPDRALRFFQGDKMLLETQVCTFCKKVTLPGIGVVSVEGSNTAPYYRFQSALIPDGSYEQLREQFKLRMMPNVGHEMSIIGLIVNSKSALTISDGEGEIDISGVDIKGLNQLQNLGCHTALKVTGTLQYFEQSNQKTAQAVQLQPSHFYFVKPVIEVVRVADVRKTKERRN